MVKLFCTGTRERPINNFSVVRCSTVGQPSTVDRWLRWLGNRHRTTAYFVVGYRLMLYNVYERLADNPRTWAFLYETLLF